MRSGAAWRARVLWSAALVACAVGCIDPGEIGDDAAQTPTDADERDAGAGGSVRIIVEPGDGADALASAIDGARSSVHMTMYLLTYQPIIDALVARHRAGVDVRIVLNRSFPSGSATNDDIYATLRAQGLQVAWAPSSFMFTHEKCVIVDAREAWIMTMNATLSGATTNREYLAVDTIPQDVADAESIFSHDFVGTPLASYGGALVVAPLNAETQLDGLIASATRTIDIEDESLSDQNIVSLLAGAAGRGVVIRVVLADNTPTTAGMAAITNLQNAGVEVRVLHDPYVAAKAIVIDGVSVFVGSENLTHNSLTANRELGLITTDPVAVAVVASTVAADFTAGHAP